MPDRQIPGWNWARTHEFQAERIERPTNLDAIQSTIAAAASASKNVRVVGSRHSFTSISDGDVIIDLSNMPTSIDVDPDDASVTLSAGVTYAQLAAEMLPTGVALANLASLSDITVAGATATATHGSGNRNGNLATAIRELSVITSSGDVRTIKVGDADFGAAPVSLGALGIVHQLVLSTEPAFEIEPAVHDQVSWTCLEASFDAIFASAYSVSVFTDWRDHVQLWTKRRTDQPTIDHAQLHDGVRAPERRHPVPGDSAESCTPQDGPGLWSHRLPHFQAGALPTAGAEVQSEFFVARSDAVEALQRLRAIGTDLEPALMVSEIRTVQRDQLWLSPHYERDCVAFHFTWHHDVAAAESASRRIVDALGPLAPSPHWGKVFDRDQFDFDALYPRWRDAKRVFAAWDPTQTFANPWIATTLGY